MPTTDSMVALADYSVLKLKNATSLGLQDVFYGDQDLIPKFPAAAIEPVSTVDEPSDNGISKVIRFQLMVLVFHSRLAAETITKRECDVYAEQVKTVMNSDRQCNGLVTWSYVSSMDYGIALRGKQTIQATRMLFEAISKGPM